MKFKYTFFVLVLGVLGMGNICLADGIPYDEKGRFSGEGGTTTLTLTKDQLKTLQSMDSNPDENWDKAHTLLLTKEQKAVLKRADGFAPTKLKIYNSRKGENDCSCGGEFFNIALWTEGKTIEVPRCYLMNEKEIEQRQKEYEGE